MKRIALPISVIITCLCAYVLGWTSLLAVDRVEISTQESDIKKQIELKLSEPPQLINIGAPMARVDRRGITARLRTMVWVDDVNIRRNFFTGVVRISVSPREPLARLSAERCSYFGVEGRRGRLGNLADPDSSHPERSPEG